MTLYNIKSYSFHQAAILGVVISPSKRKNKKIDVFKNNKYICSIGDSRFFDYPTYLQMDKELALDKRRLYWLRHKKDNVVGTAGYYALNILW